MGYVYNPLPTLYRVRVSRRVPNGRMGWVFRHLRGRFYLFTDPSAKKNAGDAHTNVGIVDSE